MQLKVNSGKLPVGWKVKKLGDVCKFQGGAQPPKSIFSTICKENYVRLIQIRDYKSDNHVVFIPKDKARRFCTKEDVMIGRYGPPVFQILRGLEGAYNVALMKATPDESQLLKDFLFYFLKTPRVQNYVINLSARAAGQSGLNKETIEPYLIPIPPLPEQERIVAVLDEAFEGIDRAIANSEKNLASSRELFESYLNAIFTQKGKGWEEKKFSDVAHLSRGQNPPKSKFVNNPQEGYVRFYQIRDGKNDNYEVYVPDSPQLHKVEPDDILMVAYRHIGRVFRGASGAFNVALCKIKNKNRSVLHDDYLFHIIPTDFVRGELMKQAERSLIPSMSVKHLAEIKIPVPPIDEQEIIVSKINNLYSETQRLEAIYRQKLAALNELKQSILQKAFTGELTADTPKIVKEEIAA